jgi:hypothetical protein
MPSIWVPEAFAAFTADGTAAGVVTVASTSPFYSGAECFLSSDNTTGQRALITDILSSTTFRVRFLAEFPNRVPTYGYSDIHTNFTVALNAKVSMPAQVVQIDQPTGTKRSAP